VTSKSLPERQGYAERVHCRVGIVGLGHLGQAFAVNLITDGHQVFAYDRNPERMKPLRGTGAYVAAQLADLAPCDVVISSLTDDDALTAVALGTEGLVSVLAVGAVHISMSTVSPTLSQRLAEEHALLGQDYVAAPVLLTGNDSVAGCQGSAARSGGSRTPTPQLINGQRWALRHRVRLRLQPTDGNAGELSQGVVDIPFDVPDVRCEDGRAEAHVRIDWYRSVYNIQHAFAVGSSIDELAATANADSVQVLLVRPETEYEPGPNGLCRKEVDRHSSMPVF
jgi:hypothetical protein